MQNNIVLITDNKEIAENIQKKIVLLRDSDKFETIPLKNCFEEVKKQKANLIIYHLTENEEEAENFLSFLQKLKQTKELFCSSVLLLYDELDENVLCAAFEKGLTDFVSTKSNDSELTIRTIWCLQKRENIYEAESKKDILSQLKIIDKNNHVYTENYTYTVLKEESKKNWGTFVVVAPDINIRSKISPIDLMNIIKKNVRTCDILGYASDFKIYLWFRETKKEDVSKILEKIKLSLTVDFTICAGYIETKNIAFDKAEEYANNALSKALLKGDTFIYAKEPKTNEINLEDNIQNFKLHKENFIKKLGNILSPLFYQTQKRIEEKLFETTINQNVTEEKSVFSLENELGKSLFTVTYPGFAKINIEIIHDVKEMELKAEKLYIDTKELSEEKIEYLLDCFIKDFQNYTNC